MKGDGFYLVSFNFVIDSLGFIVLEILIRRFEYFSF